VVFAGIDHPSIPYDYIIFKSNNTFYAVGTKPGYLDFYETTKTKVINAILTKYPTFTGTIYDKENNEVRSYENGVLITAFPIIKQSPQQPASYIIFKDGDYICAKNGETGKIDFRDTDAATVIQQAIDALPEYSYPYGGGHIHIKYGVYEITKKIIVDKPLWLTGEGRYARTVLKAADGLNDRLLEVYLEGENYWTEIEKMWLEGNKGNQSAGDYLLYIYGGYPILRDLYVMRAYKTGIYVNAQDFHFYNVFSEFNGEHGWRIACNQNGQLYSCTAWENEDSGIIISGKRWSIVNCRIMKNKGGTYKNAGLYVLEGENGQIIGGYVCENQCTGIDLYNAKHIQIVGVMVRDNSQEANNTYDGIKIRGNSNHNVITGCTVFNTLTNKQRYGIAEQDTADYNFILGNIVYSNAAGEITTVGTNTIVKHNTGYVTENSGTATFSGDGSTTDFEISAHGLAVTDPEKIVVKVTPISDDAIAASPCVGYVDPTDNTKIRVKFASAPASGADNVKIKWLAEVC